MSLVKLLDGDAFDLWRAPDGLRAFRIKEISQEGPDCAAICPAVAQAGFDVSPRPRTPVASRPQMAV